MTEEDKMKTAGAFYKWVIKDPYPELTAWDEANRTIGAIGRLPGFRWLHALGPRPDISAHKAWRDGYDFAKNLVMKELE